MDLVIFCEFSYILWGAGIFSYIHLVICLRQINSYASDAICKEATEDFISGNPPGVATRVTRAAHKSPHPSPHPRERAVLSIF